MGAGGQRLDCGHAAHLRAASTIQSRALAGMANGTLIFCLPGSTGACRTAWERILRPQLDLRTEPCNFALLLPRLSER